MPEQTPPVLDRLWDEVPVDHLPVGDLLVAGHARRRRRRALAGGVAAAAALVVAGGVAGAQLLDGGQSGGTAAGPAPGATTRLVGIGRVAVGVPASWDENAASCNSPIRDTTYFPTPQDCIGPLRLVSSVAITSLPPSRSVAGFPDLTADGEIGGHQVVASPATCSPGQGESCRQTFGVPDLDAYFSVTIPQDEPGGALGEIRAIRESLTILPQDQVAVPFVFQPSLKEARAVLQRAGLDVEVLRTPCPAGADCGFGVMGSTPAAGRVVPLGSTVTIDVMTRRSGS